MSDLANATSQTTPDSLSLSRARSANPLAPPDTSKAQALAPSKGTEQTEAGTSAPGQPLPAGPASAPVVQPPQLQTMRQLIDVLEQRSQGIIQQEVVALAHVVAQQNPTAPPRSPARTAASRRQPPANNPVQPESEASLEPVHRHKYRGKPPSPPSPPSTSSSSPELPSSDSSSSSREYVPKKKIVGKQKAKETRAGAGPFIVEIADTKIPKALEKHPPLNIYTGKGDPEEHVDTFDLMLDYRDASDNVRCKLFPLSLSKSALKWYRELPAGSVKSWT